MTIIQEWTTSDSVGNNMALTSVNDLVEFNVAHGDYIWFTIVLTGTLTATVEVTLDGTNWATNMFRPLNAATHMASGVASYATAGTSTHIADVRGAIKARLRISAFTSGNVGVRKVTLTKE